MIRLIFLSLFLMALPYTANAQLTTITTDGNWSNSGIWSGGLIGDTPGEDVTMNNNINVTIQNSESYTIGDLTANNNNSVTIDAGGSLSLSPGSFLAAGNGTTITVNGTFTVNGNFTVQNNVNLIVNGTMIITGDIDMGNNGTLNVTGDVSIGGDFIAGTNTTLNIAAGGTVDVAGNLSVDNNSVLTGSGSLSVGGSCSDGTSSFCEDSQLPIELMFFKGVVSNSSVMLVWATASEINFDHFVLERSVDGKEFYPIGEISGHGTTIERHDYSFEDRHPIIGDSYYRLKEVDFDGFTKHFDFIHIDFLEEKKMTIYPNPVTGDQVTLLLNFMPDD
ncbi:MAG: hypothetical protein L0Y35_04130, partial [Flammeovirgaceae bacterium]|nr:hypothetical protein [Flammeovirgaceae bacterium]